MIRGVTKPGMTKLMKIAKCAKKRREGARSASGPLYMSAKKRRSSLDPSATALAAWRHTCRGRVAPGGCWAVSKRRRSISNVEVAYLAVFSSCSREASNSAGA